MDKHPIQQTMLTLLANYQQLVTDQLAAHGIVGEYLTGSVEENVRLLCQMRTIVFLLKTAEVSDGNNIALAEKLYAVTETRYLIETKWLQQLNSSEEANLYNYAFVILAQSYLYKATNNHLYAIALAETFSLVESKFKNLDLFKPLVALNCLEQNSAMHLFEALSFACYQADAKYMLQAIKKLQQLIEEKFWQQDKQLLAEKVSLTGQVISYEAGHWFEWVSLLWRVEQQGQASFVRSSDLYSSALVHSHLTNQGLLLNEMDQQFNPVNTQQIRIWPNLEFLRTKALIERKLPAELATQFITLFFDHNGLPKEYLSEEPVEKVKSTTGYHIAESFIDILNHT